MLFDNNEESVDEFQELHKKLLLQDPKELMPQTDQKNETFQNIIKDYFDPYRNDIPIFKPNTRICEERHGKYVTALAFTSDSKTMISGSQDLSIRIWEINCINKLIRLLKIIWGHDEAIISLQVDNAGEKIYSGSEDTTIKIWDSKSYGKLGTLRGHTKSIISILLTKDNQYLVSSGADNKLIIWDIIKKEQYKFIEDQLRTFLFY